MIIEAVLLFSIITNILSLIHPLIKDKFFSILINTFALFFSLVTAWSWWFPTAVTDTGDIIVLDTERVYAMVFYVFIFFNMFMLLARLFGVVGGVE